MAIEYIASSVASSGSAPSSLQVAKPSGVTDDDFMIAFVTIAGDRTITGVPTDWTTLGSETTGTATGDVTTAVYWKRAASEGANYTWTFSAGVDCAIAILAYSGVIGTGNPINTSAHTKITGSTVNLTAPSVTPNTAPSLVLYAFGVNNGIVGDTTFTGQSGLTKRAEADPAGSTTNRAVLCVFDDEKSSTAPTGNKDCTINDSGKAVTWSVILTPGGSAAPTFINLQPATQTSTNEGCMLGWYDGSNDVDATLARATELDTGWAVIRLYNSPTDFPTIKESKTEDVIAYGAIPMVSHKPPHTGGSWIAIWRGDYEDEIDAWVTYYKSLAPAKIIFVFHHEPHDNAVDLKPEKGLEGNAADFVKAYRYIGQKFRDADADNVFLGYSAVANTWANKGNPVGSGDVMYPGDDLVDVLCHDEYNTAGEDHSPNPGGGSGSGTITYVGGDFTTPSKGTSGVTLNVPSGRIAGDLFVVYIGTDYCNMSHTPPTGWTLLRYREEGSGGNPPDTNDDQLTGGKDLCGYLYYKVSNGTETTVTFNVASDSDPSNNVAAGTITVFRGVNTSLPIYDYAVNDQSVSYPGSSSHCDAPSIQGVNGGALVTFHVIDNPPTLSVPSGMNLVSTYKIPTSSPDDSHLVAYKLLTTTGATGEKQAGHSTMVVNDMAFALSLRPSGEGVYSYGGTSWHSFEEEYANTVALAKRLNKPLIFGEIGSNHSKPQGDRNNWFLEGAAWIKGNDDARNFLKGFCYYHVDNHDGSGHWWRFTSDADTMFQGDGQAGFVQGFVQDPYFKTEPISLITDNETQVEDFTGGIPPVASFGMATVSFDELSDIFIFSAGGIASPSDYDPVEEEAGIEFGMATITQEGIASAGAIASTLALGTPTVVRGIGAGWIFTPPIRRYNPSILPSTTGIERALRKYYTGPPIGQNVYVMIDGTITETPTDLNLVATIYHGGHVIPITDDEVTALVSAGYAEYITATISLPG